MTAYVQGQNLKDWPPNRKEFCYRSNRPLKPAFLRLYFYRQLS